ncbi:MAG TPA: DUF1828 domain-containing protein [Holophagaceae bacterium]|nr:DUF1828 domain-containing protein [Holophagaceae bacterium]
MINLETLSPYLVGHHLVTGIEQLDRGHLRLETAFRYPDGSQIDLFLKDEGPFIEPRILTDFGNTSSWLLDLQVKPWLSPKRKKLLELSLKDLAVHMNGGALELEFSGNERLMDGIVCLSQACIRMADLHYTRRSSLSLPLNEVVEELLEDFELTYQPNAEFTGRQGTPVKVDYQVWGLRTTSLIMIMGTGNPSVGHNRANEVFRTWYDLNLPERVEAKVTIFDDNSDVYRDEDLARLRDFSEVMPLSDRKAIKDLLAA